MRYALFIVIFEFFEGKAGRTIASDVLNVYMIAKDHPVSI